ncbi:hypothetical protein GN156_21690 [bacterium LRH843]|nr:hypothetical protein [bacterium LRH843]
MLAEMMEQLAQDEAPARHERSSEFWGRRGGGGGGRGWRDRLPTWLGGKPKKPWWWQGLPGIPWG